MADDLAGSGVLVHQFDAMDDTNAAGQPWIPGMGRYDTGDRISASLVYYGMVEDPGTNIPIYSFDLAGLILSPTTNTMLCAYPHDVGSISRVCDPIGVSEECIPGCTPWEDHPTWCDISEGEDVEDCAFRPSALPDVMAQRDALSRVTATEHKMWDDKKYYAELIFDSSVFLRNLPYSVEAMFFLPTRCNGDIYDGAKCEDYVRTAHRTFLQNFTLTEEQVPLLKLDLWNWEAPFTMMTNKQPDRFNTVEANTFGGNTFQGR